MAPTTFQSLAVLTLASLLVFSSTVAGARSFNTRSDLQNVPPVNQSGYAVPLVGGSCNAMNCPNTLPSPSNGFTLTLLTIGRGNETYSCSDTSANTTAVPVFVNQFTDLYDVAPLIPELPNEATLHDLIPLFAQYDYTQMQNSTLVCIGNIYTEDGATTVDLTAAGYYLFNVEEQVNVPSPEPTLNAEWIYSVSTDQAWEIYRVETGGGAVPASCAGLSGEFALSYAAEYWFYYHS